MHATSVQGRSEVRSSRGEERWRDKEKREHRRVLPAVALRYVHDERRDAGARARRESASHPRDFIGLFSRQL